MVCIDSSRKQKRFFLECSGRNICSDRYLSLPTNVRVYQTLVLPVLTYACEIWTLLAAERKRLEDFHAKCQRHIAMTWWQDHEQNTDVCLFSVRSRSCAGFNGRSSLFGHVARLPENAPAHQALRATSSSSSMSKNVNLSLNGTPPADLCSGHETWNGSGRLFHDVSNIILGVISNSSLQFEHQYRVFSLNTVVRYTMLFISVYCRLNV